jgi:hypothetical protein
MVQEAIVAGRIFSKKPNEMSARDIDVAAALNTVQ